LLLDRGSIGRLTESLLLVLMSYRLLLVSESTTLILSERLLIVAELRLLYEALFFLRFRQSLWALFERVSFKLLKLSLEDAVLFLKGVGHLSDAWGYLLEEELDDLFSLIFKKHLEVLDNHVAC